MYYQKVTAFFLMLSASICAQDIYDVNTIQQLELKFTSPSWQDELIDLKDAGQKERAKADAILNGVSYTGVGVRFKGNSSYNSAKKDFNRKLPFNIKSDFTNKTTLFNNSIQKIKLANGFRDPSMVREVLAYEILADYMPAPRANFLNVKVNGKDYGLYTHVESIDKDFVKLHYQVEGEVLIKCDQEYTIKKPTTCPGGSEKPSLVDFGGDTTCFTGTYELKSDYGFKKLRKLIVFLHKFPKRIEEVLDVDQTLWMLAFNNVLVDLDSYSGLLAHNWYLAEDSHGRLHPLVWDLNLSFGGFVFDGSKSKPLTIEEMQEYSLFAHFKDENWPLIHLLLKNPKYRKIYIAHIKTIYEDWIENDQYYKRALELQQVIDAAVKEDANKFYSYANFKANLNRSSKAGKVQIVGLKELMESRKLYLKNHKLLSKKAPEIQNQQVEIKGDNSIVKATVSSADKVFLKYRTASHAPFKSILMESKGGGEYVVSLNKAELKEYFIFAENKEAASFLPKRAEYEFFTL